MGHGRETISQMWQSRNQSFPAGTFSFEWQKADSKVGCGVHEREGAMNVGDSRKEITTCSGI